MACSHMYIGTKETLEDVAKGEAKYISFQKRRKPKAEPPINKALRTKVGERKTAESSILMERGPLPPLTCTSCSWTVSPVRNFKN